MERFTMIGMNLVADKEVKGLSRAQYRGEGIFYLVRDFVREITPAL
jgi:hypothetical protein